MWFLKEKIVLGCTRLYLAVVGSLARWAEVYFPTGINQGQCSCLHRADSWALAAQTLVMKYLW